MQMMNRALFNRSVSIIERSAFENKHAFACDLYQKVYRGNAWDVKT